MRERSRGIVAAALVVGVVLGGGRVVGAQALSFEQTVADLTNSDKDARLRAAGALKEAAYPEAAVPLARAVLDADDAVQYEAITGELNIFLAEPLVPRRRVAYVVEVRNRISAQAIFEGGWRALDPRVVPNEVLTALRSAGRDESPAIAVEALYAFGALSANAYGRDLTALQRASAQDLATLLGASDAKVRLAATLVIGRLYWRRPGDPAVDESLGDALVTTLNDGDPGVRRGAMTALGALRYERGAQALTDLVQYYGRGVDGQTAMFALARIAHVSSVPLFEQALDGRDAGLKAAAIEGLARMGGVSRATRLADASAKDRSADVQLSAHFADVVLSEGSINVLVDGLTKAALHNRALVLLSEVAPGRGSIFSPQMPDPKPAVRADLLDALGLSNDPDLLPQVERLLNDPDPAVARTATRAVFRLKGQGAPSTRP